MASLINALPGAVAQGLIWGIMAIGVYLTYRILDIADLTVDGSLGTGGAVCIMLMLTGHNVWVSLAGAVIAGMLAGLVTGILHTFMGIPAILSGILTQLSLYSVNLKIMGKANQAINVDKFDLLVSLRFIRKVAFYKNTIFVVAVGIILLILVLYWFFGTELGCSMRATGCNDKMARAQGINTDFCRVLGLMLSNGLVALSGALLCQYQGFAVKIMHQPSQRGILLIFGIHINNVGAVWKIPAVFLDLSADVINRKMIPQCICFRNKYDIAIGKFLIRFPWLQKIHIQ